MPPKNCPSTRMASSERKTTKFNFAKGQINLLFAFYLTSKWWHLKTAEYHSAGVQLNQVKLSHFVVRLIDQGLIENVVKKNSLSTDWISINAMNKKWGSIFWGLRKLFNYTPLIYYPNEFRWKTFQCWGHLGTLNIIHWFTFIVAKNLFLNCLNRNCASATMPTEKNGTFAANHKTESNWWFNLKKSIWLHSWKTIEH